MGLVLAGCQLWARLDEAVPIVWGHRPYVVRMAVTNHTAEVRCVAKVTTAFGDASAPVSGEYRFLMAEADVLASVPNAISNTAYEVKAGLERTRSSSRFRSR